MLMAVLRPRPRLPPVTIERVVMGNSMVAGR
jgi:hypothetical protein